MAALARSVDYQMKIVEAAIEVNEKQKESIIVRVKRLLPELRNKTIALLGLSFKPDTDDMRESPAVRIVADLQAEGAQVRAYDPAAMELARRVLTNVDYCADEYDAAKRSDGLIVVTEWNQFRNLDLNRLNKVMREPNVIDLRNIYEPEMMKTAGFRYLGMGRNDLRSFEASHG